MMDRLNLRLLRNLAAVAVSVDRPYVEVGVFRGLSLASVAQIVDPAPAIGIDNFSLFDEDGMNQIEALRVLDSNGLRNARVIDADFEVAIDGLLSEGMRNRVGLFFIDGAHDYRSQLVALLKARDLIAPSGVIVVDDANYAHVRQSTKDFLDHFPDYGLVFEAYNRAAPMNLPEDERSAARDGWGNGVHVIHHDPDRRFERLVPETIGKQMFEASHEVMRHGLGQIAAEILVRCSSLGDLVPEDPGFAQSAEDLRGLVLAHRGANPGVFAHRNTYSDGLVPERSAVLH
jgi:predicted O-methyltransferase YrrM